MENLIIKKFCGKCGLQIIKTFCPISKVWEYDEEGGRYYPYQDYDEHTGVKKVGYEYRCPRKRWYNSHYFLRDTK